MTRLAPGERQTLASVLRPPDGFGLDAAAGTTFTLDMQSLLAVPLTFALLDGVETPPAGEDAEAGAHRPEEPLLMSALLAYAKRIRLLCDAAYIAPPKTPSKLFALLEDTIVPVSVEAAAHFHPKLWLLRFRDHDQTARHRLVIATRNLTDSSSWDLACVLDEDPEGTLGAADSVAALVQACAPGDSLITGLAESAARARFSPPPGFGDLEVHAWAESRGSDPVSGRRGSRMLVISPFIGSGRLRDLAKRTDRLTVVSRPSTFEGLTNDGELPTTDLRRLKELTAYDDAPSGELHAKLVVLDEPGERSRWWLGSLNATDNGVRRNAEAVIEMTTATSTGGVDAVLRDEDGGLGRMLEAHRARREPLDDDDESERERSLRKAITAAEWHVRVVGTAGGEWSATVTVQWPDTLLPSETEMRVRFASQSPSGDSLMTSGAKRSEVTLPRVGLADVSRFLHVDLRAPGCKPVRLTVCAGLEVPDADERRTELFKAIAPDADVMLRLILVLLRSGNDPAGAAGEARKILHGKREAGDDLPSLPFVEEMVRSFARDPGRLGEAGKLIANLPDGHPRTRDLRDLWATFEHALAMRG